MARTKKFSSKKVDPQIWKGKWRDVDQEERNKFYALPVRVRELMNEVNPDWDWVETSEGKGKDHWLVVRQYEDEKKEITRVAAIIKARKDFV